MIPFGKGLRYLVPREFEVHYRRLLRRLEDWGKLSNDSKLEEIFFDLSRVEWVDLGALVHIILTIEDILKRGFHVTVAMPLPQARKSEEQWMRTTSIKGEAERTRYRIERRTAVYNFLDYLRFQQALQADHMSVLPNQVWVVDDYRAIASQVVSTLNR